MCYNAIPRHHWLIPVRISSTASSTMPVSTPALGSDGKPIKLRAACNNCFSAKVGSLHRLSNRRLIVSCRSDVTATRSHASVVWTNDSPVFTVSLVSARWWESAASDPSTIPLEQWTRKLGWSTSNSSTPFPHPQRPTFHRTQRLNDNVPTTAGHIFWLMKHRRSSTATRPVRLYRVSTWSTTAVSRRPATICSSITTTACRRQV